MDECLSRLSAASFVSILSVLYLSTVCGRNSPGEGVHRNSFLASDCRTARFTVLCREPRNFARYSSCNTIEDRDRLFRDYAIVTILFLRKAVMMCSTAESSRPKQKTSTTISGSLRMIQRSIVPRLMIPTASLRIILSHVGEGLIVHQAGPTCILRHKKL